MAGMAASEVVAISATLTGMITLYGVPEAGVMRGMGADWDGGG
jgi:hypothetical protein